MVESGCVLGKGRIRASIEKLSQREPKKGRIYVSIEKWQDPGQYREKVESCKCQQTVPGSTGKRSNLCEYRKMEESESVPGKGRIRSSVEKLSRGVPEKGQICVSSKKWQNLGEYREKVESVRVSKNYSGEYRRRVKSVLVPKHGRIWANTGKR